MLKPGYTLMHEHIYIDLSKFKNNIDCKLDLKDSMIEEMKDIYKKGVRNIVELTNIGMGRNIEYLKEISEKTDMNIICSTGFYKSPYFPEYISSMSTKDIEKIILKDILEGIDGSDVKAKIIGEIGTSKNEMTDDEKKVFLASISASNKTNTPISTHLTLGTHAIYQAEFFKKNGMNMQNLIIGHVDLSGDIDMILKLLDYGVHISFDTVGKNSYYKDEDRAKMLKILEEKKLISKVFLSLDITRRSHLKSNGGIGYSYLFDTFLPMLYKQGISEKSIELMLRNNPASFLGDKV